MHSPLTIDKGTESTSTVESTALRVSGFLPYTLSRHSIAMRYLLLCSVTTFPCPGPWRVIAAKV